MNRDSDSRKPPATIGGFSIVKNTFNIGYDSYLKTWTRRVQVLRYEEEEIDDSNASIIKELFLSQYQSIARYGTAEG